jgi:hypothetical protein
VPLRAGLPDADGPQRTKPASVLARDRDQLVGARAADEPQAGEFNPRMPELEGHVHLALGLQLGAGVPKLSSPRISLKSRMVWTPVRPARTRTSRPCTVGCRLRSAQWRLPRKAGARRSKCHSLALGLLKERAGYGPLHQDVVAGVEGSSRLDQKERRQPELFVAGSLRELLPDEHVLVRVDRVLDLGWLHDEVGELDDAATGRPSIDPEVAVRLMLAGLLLGIVHRFCETDQAAALGVIVRRSSWSFSSMPRMRSSLRSRWTS